ncbi:FecR family protein [Pollutimonas bauzanensis]|uniref:FecR family protein n=1 Tax=Pollutimonas bauzanensis TaxID=658167 RepID=A0A1M6A6S2_9BURK|nr:FecR domain-containing protein [Pollutimonas bauzanensis]SHI32119.1 FecR family protein [Pollutimonas bauzanensis]
MNPQSHTAASPDSMLEDEALDWFVRRMGGHDEAVEEALLTWLAAAPAHRSAYARWEDEWAALDAVPAAARARLAAAPAASARWRPARRLTAALLAGCMALAVVLALAPGAPQYSRHYATQPGELSRVALPDGSELELDTGTTLDVALFAGRREVSLPQGQAMFSVQGDAARPFDVLAGPLRITVVGTRFAVRHTPGSPGYPGVHISVESGRVHVGPADPWSWLAFWREPATRRGVELRAGQQLTLDDAGRPGRITPVAPDNIAPWRARRISFEDLTIRQALAEFARYGHAPASAASEKVAALRVTGTFDADDPDTFYRLLPKVLPVQVRRTAAGTAIEPAP